MIKWIYLSLGIDIYLNLDAVCLIHFSLFIRAFRHDPLHHLHQSPNRKYKDYVYRKMLVQEYLKKLRIFKKVKPKNDVITKTYIIAYVKTQKKIRFLIHYVKLLFKIRFPKDRPTCRRQVVNPRHQTPQGQSVAKPETPLQNIYIYIYISVE